MKKTVLENGLTIISETFPHVKSVTVSYFVEVGSKHENNYPRGTAHFVEHMLFTGTETKTAKNISNALADIGARHNASTSPNATRYFAHVPYYDWKEAYTILHDLVWYSIFPEYQVEKERKVILEEIKSLSNDVIQHEATKIVFENLYPSNHTLSDPAGTKDSVKSITRDDLVRFVNEFYHTPNMTIVLTGAVSHEDAVEFIRSFVFPRTEGVKPVFTMIKENNRFSETTLMRNIEEGYLGISYPLCTIHDKDRYALSVLHHALGAGPDSRLYQTVREEHGLAYMIDASNMMFSEYGFGSIHVLADKENIEKVKKIVYAELGKIKNEMISEDELRRSKKSLLADFSFSCDNPLQFNYMLGTSALCGLSCNVDEYIEGISNVTCAEVFEVAKKYFDFSVFTNLIIIPKEDTVDSSEIA